MCVAANGSETLEIMFYPLLSGPASYSAAIGAQADANAARAEARAARTETELMRSDIERLLMITEALWTFLKQEHGYSDEDLAKVVSEIDLRDGRLDGKVAANPSRPCPNCGKVVSNRRPFCIYCGKPVPVNPFAH